MSVLGSSRRILTDAGLVLLGGGVKMVNRLEVVQARPDAIPTGTNKDARAFLDDCMAVLSASSKLSLGRCLREVKVQFWAKYYEK